MLRERDIANIETLLNIKRPHGVHEKLLVLVSCSKSKQANVSKAADLYKSPLFNKSKTIAQRRQAPWLILSAKYGLISPECIIAPYDEYLSNFTQTERASWGERVGEKLKFIVNKNTDIWILASDKYADPIRAALPGMGARIHAPLSKLSIGKMGHWLASANRSLDRQSAITRLYQILRKLAQEKTTTTLRDVMRYDTLPGQGLYVFLDAAEPSAFNDGMSRIVRIGTHGVSHGSKANLRTRLRTHLGTQEGLGNHRGSIFRLHVGAALIAKNGWEDRYRTWGKGQTATRNIRDSEQSLERMVSEYIGSLSVAYAPVAGPAAAQNIRSKHERNLIALLTERSIHIDPASPVWLGNHSIAPTIRQSGLWNIQHHGADFDHKLFRAFEALVDHTGELPF